MRSAAAHDCTSHRFEVARHFCFKVKTKRSFETSETLSQRRSFQDGYCSPLVVLCLYVHCDKPVRCARKSSRMCQGFVVPGLVVKGQCTEEGVRDGEEG